MAFAAESVADIAVGLIYSVFPLLFAEITFEGGTKRPPRGGEGREGRRRKGMKGRKGSEGEKGQLSL